MELSYNDCGCSAEAAHKNEEATPSAPRELIPFILDRYHAVHRRELPELARLANKVETVHAEHARCPRGLAQFLADLEAELETHMTKEEQVLFPLLLANGGGCAPLAIRRMRLEHEDHHKALGELVRLTNDFSPPEGACGGWRRLYAGCAKLKADLEAHIALENEVLFPAFE
ncbi:MAG: hemerythrin domain-containing protein [Proteobacteria bacterium]|nr:hemerythrin domain-containing protein [Pseudomonadota bacterium]